MKKLILTFFIIVLILLLLKNKTENFYNQGCEVPSLVAPTEPHFYNCLLNDIDRYNTILPTSTHSRRRAVEELGKRIIHYFISLYKHGLEKHYRLIVAFVPSTFREGTRQVYVPRQEIFFKDFLRPGYEQGNYRLKTMDNNIVKRLNIDINRVSQINGILLGMGFKMALSTRRNNQRGYKCTRYETRPSENRRGYCIPGRFWRYNEYLPGGSYYDYRRLAQIAINPSYSGGRLKYEKETSPWIYRKRGTHQRSKGCGSRHDQVEWQFQTGLDSCISSCYLRHRDDCHSAYGDSRIKEIYVIPDPNFFNKFYASDIISSRKNDFSRGNFSSFSDYHGYNASWF